MDFLDRVLTCNDCGNEFVFTAGEQLFFFDKQFKNDPKRCKPCKSKRLGTIAKPGSTTVAGSSFRTETRTLCSTCGVETTVPFRPTQGRPVLCRGCFQKRQTPLAAVPMLTGQAQANVQMNSAAAELIAATSTADHLVAIPLELVAASVQG